MRSILVVGAGQSGLQLALSLLAEGYDVTVMSARTPQEIRAGWVMSTQAMFGLALRTERAYGLDLWQDLAPPIGGLDVRLATGCGQPVLRVPAPLDEPAASTDQRLKMAAWLELFEQRGGTVHYQGVTTADLDGLTALGRYDLTVVATGKGELVSVFDRDPGRSRWTTPQRGLALAYVHGMTPEPGNPTPVVGLNVVPEVGELFVIPALTLGGVCDILFWEAVPDGPADLWHRRRDPAEQLKLMLDLARQYVPWVHQRCAAVELTDARATLSGRYTPTVRRPVAHLPSGGAVLGMADVVVANDPITGQGSNTAAKCAAAYLEAILDHGDRPFDETWMTATFESFWARTAQPVTDWTNTMLGPLPAHVREVLTVAAGDETVARRFGNGFSDPADLAGWLLDPQRAAGYLASVG